MAQQKATSPYFKSVHSPPSSPTVIATSMPFSLRYPPKHFIDSSKMVNFAKLDTKALIEAATASSTAQLKQPSPYALEAPQSLKASSCKRPRNSAQKDQSNDSTFASDSSEATPLAKPSKKKQKELLDDEDEECSMSPHPLRNTGKIHTSFLKLLESDEDGDIASKLPQSTNSRPTTSLRKPSSSSRKPAMPTKRRKSLGTPVPSSLESAHPADQELFKMKADGKPWKEIKVVWESLMNKKIGDSTLSVRYCKMKENFQKFGAKDDMRILKFKAKVESELEAEKWERVALMTQEDGGKVITAKEVRLLFKEIEKNGFEVSTGIDDGRAEVPEVDMDPIDRELTGVGDADRVGDFSELDENSLDQFMGLEQDFLGQEGGVGETNQVDAKAVKSCGERNVLEVVELEGEARRLTTVAVDESLLVRQGCWTAGAEDSI